MRPVWRQTRESAASASARPQAASELGSLAAARRQLMRLALALVVWVSSPAAWASSGIAVFTSGQGEAYTDVVNALTTELRKTPGQRIVVGAIGTDRLEDMLAGAGQTTTAGGLLIVTVGANATRLVLEHADLRTPVLAILLPRITF